MEDKNYEGVESNSKKGKVVSFGYLSDEKEKEIIVNEVKKAVEREKKTEQAFKELSKIFELYPYDGADTDKLPLISEIKKIQEEIKNIHNEIKSIKKDIENLGYRIGKVE